jgi:RNA polymerase sigma factor (sigma-70 family)
LESSSTNTVIRFFRRAAQLQEAAWRTDGQLLEAFIGQKDAVAFEILVNRHGPMVFGVCCRVLRNHHDAEDAFQAAFLILARNALSVRPRGQVANWLHGVAFRTAMKARSMAAKRRGRECQVTEMPEPEAAQPDQWYELNPLIDQELNGLPARYRIPILLCDLHGKTIKEATEQLGWPQGTFAGRLARARKLLAKRLTNRGVVLSAPSLALFLSAQATSAVVPSPLLMTTVKTATLIATGKAALAVVVPAKVASLMKGVMMSMMLTKIKTTLALLLAVAFVGFGTGLSVHFTAAAPPLNNKESESKPPNAEAAHPPKSVGKAMLLGEWQLKLDDVNVSLIFGPGNTIRRFFEGRDTPNDIGTFSVDWTTNPYHLDVKWGTLPVIRMIMEFADGGKLRLDGLEEGDNYAKAFTNNAKVLTKHEKLPPGSDKAERKAEIELATANFYRRTRKFASAKFYYELIRYRYPDTLHSQVAQLWIEELKRHRIRLADGSDAWEQEALELPQPPQPPAAYPGDESSTRSREINELKQKVRDLERRLAALEKEARIPGNSDKAMRVGNIVVVGNTKTPTSEILKKLKLAPGQVIDENALRIAEQNLAAFNGTIEVIDTDDSNYKDIVVKIKKK